jgi:hypothetical protein
VDGHSVSRADELEQHAPVAPRRKQAFYATFGHAHSDPPGALMHKYLVVYAVDEEAAREKVIAERGDDWAFIYTEEQFAPQIEKYDLELWKEIT